jgi:hypothetical protein
MDFVWVAADDTNAIQNTIVDAKGDLIAASAADTPARLAVGNNGETLVADSSTSTGLRYNPQNALVNPVINGGMDIWQRGTTGFNPNGLVYTADRWQSYSPAIPRTISRQTVSDSTNLPNIQYAIRLQRTAGNTATDYIAIANSFESVNSIPFANKTVTLSFYARAGANYSAASSAMKAEVYIGTGTDQSVIATGYTGQSTPISQASIPLTTTWQRFAYSGTIASTTTEMAVRFDTNAFVGTAGANDWIEVTGVQIDLGTYTASTAPSFRRSQGTIQGELDACMRYAINFNYNPAGKASYNTIANGYAASTTSARVAVNLPVAMRTQPSSVTTSGNFVLDNTASFPAVTSITINQGGTTTVLLTVNVASGLTSGQNLTLYANNDATASVILSAEL